MNSAVELATTTTLDAPLGSAIQADSDYIDGRVAKLERLEIGVVAPTRNGIEVVLTYIFPAQDMRRRNRDR